MSKAWVDAVEVFIEKESLDPIPRDFIAEAVDSVLYGENTVPCCALGVPKIYGFYNIAHTFYYGVETR